MRLFFLTIAFVLSAGAVLADAAATKALNDLRASKGRSAVSYSAQLERAAAAHAQELARTGRFSHTGANGSSVGDRVRGVGYRWCHVSENIAKGQRDLATVLNAWAGSSGHYRNMVNRKAREFAIARAKGNVWVMVLARPC